MLHKTHVQSEAKTHLLLLNRMECDDPARQLITARLSTASSVVSSVFSASGSKKQFDAV